MRAFLSFSDFYSFANNLQEKEETKLVSLLPQKFEFKGNP